MLFSRRFVLLALSTLLLAPAALAQKLTGPVDWAEWRGPLRDGRSFEKNLPSKWSPAGDGLLWKAPYGGRSTPVVFGDRLYLQNTAEKGEREQERVIAFNADTGKLVWEHRFNVYLSDVPAHRVGWASPAVDPATGNVYVLGGGGTLLALSGRDGKVLWERTLGEDFGLLTTHGGRTMSPIVDGDLVIASGVMFVWGQHGQGRHRLVAFDKRTGEAVWVSAPGGRPYDTTYSPPLIANVAGTRLLLQGGSDGQVYAVKPQTGEFVWKYEISKRGLNTGVVVSGTTAYLTHSEENLNSSEMGMLTAVDATAKGDIKPEHVKWTVTGWQGGFSSPILDGERLYQIDNGANLGAFDTNTGKQLWLQNLGTIQKASPVLADGKLYVGTENGKFFIIEPSATGAKVLDEDQLGTAALPESIIASVAVSRGRIFLVTDAALYAFGKKSNAAPPPLPGDPVSGNSNPTVAHVQVVPTELLLRPGDKASFRARLFDERGNFMREEKATWTLEGLKGAVTETGQFTAAGDAAQAGLVKATVGGVAGAARVRVIPPLPWAENFDALEPNASPAHWTNATMKFAVREMEGNKVLVKTTEGSSLLSRSRAYMGQPDLHDYTVEADVRGAERRRTMGDAGVIAQRYALTLYGNGQRLSIEPWQPEVERTASVPFEWKKDTWYRMKLRVENLPDGRVRARGKVWLTGQPEPEAWTIEKVDALPNRVGAPGIFGNALAEIYFDNLKVYANN
ncbi:MAG TPA: PQQ-binding-like beta-propeller repeat protein [Pyrinomonadaceae bacterium]